MPGRETSGHGDLLRYQSHVMADQVQVVHLFILLIILIILLIMIMIIIIIKVKKYVDNIVQCPVGRREEQPSR